MVKFKEAKSWVAETPEKLKKELDIFSCYEVKKKQTKGLMLKKYYVPKNELEFYEEWKNKIEERLSQVDNDSVFIQGIAERHGFELK